MTTETRCLCDKLPAGSICVFCAGARGFPAKLYVSNREYDDDPSITDRHCTECRKVVKADFDRCYDCRVRKAVAR